jgi:hypothetical protein
VRILLTILFVLFATAARAGSPGPCPSFHAGWALSSPGSITNILWDQYTQQMYFIWNTGLPPNTTTVSDYYPVANSSVMQSFSQSKNWVQTFNTLIAPTYKAVLLQEINNCPALQDAYTFVCPLENENGVQELAAENGAVLITENAACATVPGSYVWVN